MSHISIYNDRKLLSKHNKKDVAYRKILKMRKQKIFDEEKVVVIITNARHNRCPAGINGTDRIPMRDIK